MVASVLLLLIIVLFSLQFKPVQTYVAKKAAAYLSKEWHSTVSIGSLYVKPFKSIVFVDLLVLDQQKDTLLNTPRLTIDINQFSLKQRIIDVNTVQLDNGTFYLKEFKDSTSNLDFIINYFDTGNPEIPARRKKPYHIKFDRVILNNIAFRYKNFKNDSTVNGVNFDDLNLKSLNGIFEGLNTNNHILQTHIKNLTFHEKSGFYLKNLTAFTTIDSNAIELKNLMLVTNQSRLSDYFKMQFKTFKDFNKFVKNIKMTANFSDAHLSSRDIAYFAPELRDMKLNLDLDGQISGFINNIRAKQLSIKAGKATYIKGDFIVKGLPKLKETFMDLRIEMAGTNKKDLEEILGNTTGTKEKMLPELISKFGSVNFSGAFTGFQNDFIAYGEFKTKLGRFKSDVNMKIDANGIPSYSGNIKTFDFDIGTLLEEKSLNRITSSLDVAGRGTKLSSLREKLKGRVAYIDFNDYRYRNVTVNGIFEKKRFNGEMKIDDKNVQLDFVGGVDLNPNLPVFNFDAHIKNAKLHTLKLLKDSMMVDADFSTNFSGSNLNNIQGNLLVAKIQLTNNRGSYHVDSVRIHADGTGIDRSLVINSDILDASIKGQYDLNSIVSYYKAIAKTYIPSLETKVFKYNAQIFKFNLEIKRFEPIAEFIAPGLSIEDRAIIIGNFDSRNNTATLNGFISKLKYGKITANDIIIDESTTPTQLQAVITSGRIDLNDSLFLKDVNISNIIRNDSLSLNVKLSNADELNQLDLNGLVEFGATSVVSVLPSILKINGDDWKIQEKVQISFKDGKTTIDNFDLSNKKQLVTIDGTLSDDPADHLLVGFKDFNLKTLNPFAKTFGLTLAGNLNGKTQVASALKALKVNNNITIDSLSFNNTFIGSLKDTSSYDKSKNKINVWTIIDTDQKRTLAASGNIQLKEELIDLNISMDDTKLVVFEPFVKKLVSNLKGTISSDITVKGSLNNPAIDGEVSFKNGQLTVNYLKTSYILNDRVSVDNSVIRLDNLKLTDLEGNEAIANGIVDLNNLDDPTINAVLNTNGFMALNTTSKDNSVYYGTAYATGKFTFRGPTSRMAIDIDAKTEKGTVFNLPLNSSETVSDRDFITFVSKDTLNAVKKTTRFDGLTLNFKLVIDPNTIANIYTSIGTLSGKGNAELALRINSLGDFEMVGDYVIETGSFDLSLQEVINKRFSIRQGGTIRWTGNPTAAQINLKAIYALRANLVNLYTAANRNPEGNPNSSVQTEVEMGLTGLLLQPDIKLDIFFPANPVIKDEFQSYFNDQENRALQAVNLILRRSFAPGAGKEAIGRQLTTGVQNTAQELFFNQINNVLSSLNLNFVDINVRSFSEANASFNLFNDRIIINAGIVDNRNVNNLTFSNFSGSDIGREIEILALIKKDGTLVGKLANKPPTVQSVFTNPGIDQNANVTSVGLIYSLQFDTFKEFLQRLTGQYKKNRKATIDGIPILKEPSKVKETVKKQVQKK